MRNTIEFVKTMREKGYLRPGKGDTLWIQSDGCERQYKCSNNCAICIHVAQQFQIIIDWFITPAGHGKDLADSMAGTDKHYLAKGYLTWDIRPDRIVDGEVRSEAEKACEFLSHKEGPLHDNRHGGLDP